MTSTHWPHQQHKLLRILAYPTTHYLLPAVEWSNQKFVGPSLQVYGLGTPPDTDPKAN